VYDNNAREARVCGSVAPPSRAILGAGGTVGPRSLRAANAVPTAAVYIPMVC